MKGCESMKSLVDALVVTCYDIKDTQKSTPVNLSHGTNYWLIAVVLLAIACLLLLVVMVFKCYMNRGSIFFYWLSYLTGHLVLLSGLRTRPLAPMSIKFQLAWPFSVLKFIKYGQRQSYTGILQNRYFVKATGKHLAVVSFNKVAGLQRSSLWWKETPAQVFFFEFCEIFQSTIFMEHIRATVFIWSCADYSWWFMSILLSWQFNEKTRSVPLSHVSFKRNVYGAPKSFFGLHHVRKTNHDALKTLNTTAKCNIC